MKYEHWQIPAAPEDAIKTLMDAGYPYLVSSVLAARGVTTSEQAAEALEREKTLAHSPFLMKDMDKAVARISKALENGEKLAVFGDYDVDGITSTCLLTDYLRSRGADVTMHIPRRIEEGYGLGCDAIRALSESGVTLIVTVDCGITGVDETAYAATLGVDLVITDHHECKEQLPAAVAVVDPHRPDCPYPFKHLAGVGVALKLVLALGEGREDALFARYCTLAAIGTIADVMRMEGENRTIVQCGLESIDRSDFTGLHALLRETICAHKRILFNGNGYDDAWIREAAARGLSNYRTTPDCMPHLLDKKNVEMLTAHGVYTESELRSRCDIMLENYSKTVLIEANTMVEMAKTDILPAIEAYTLDVAKTAEAKKALDAYLVCGYETKLVQKLSALTDRIAERAEALAEAVVALHTIEGVEAEANAIRDTILGRMSELRVACDEAETLTAKKYWPYPTYGDLLFGVK